MHLVCTLLIFAKFLGNSFRRLRWPDSREWIRRFARITWFSRIVSGFPSRTPFLRMALRGRGAKNCESQVWGDSRESLARHENRFRSRPGKPNQRKGQDEKFMNFAHFCEFRCVFSLGEQARFTHIELLFRNAPAKSSWTDLSLVWFAGATPESRCFSANRFPQVDSCETQGIPKKQGKEGQGGYLCRGAREVLQGVHLGALRVTKHPQSTPWSTSWPSQDRRNPQGDGGKGMGHMSRPCPTIYDKSQQNTTHCLCDIICR